MGLIWLDKNHIQNVAYKYSESSSRIPPRGQNNMFAILKLSKAKTGN